MLMRKICYSVPALVFIQIALGSPAKASMRDTPYHFCVHGAGVISEDGGATHATRFFSGDFDGDGKTDYLCKDVRKDDSNGNRLLMWLILGNGQTPYSGVWDDWCTHRNSHIAVSRRGNKDILVCWDANGGYWERSLP